MTTVARLSGATYMQRAMSLKNIVVRQFCSAAQCRLEYVNIHNVCDPSRTLRCR